MQAEASLEVLALLSQPVAAPYRSVLAVPAAGAQGPGWALPGAKAGLHPHRAAGASLQLQPGVPVQLRHERRLPRHPLWPRAVELSAGFTIGRARTRGAHAGCAAFTPTPARLWNYLVDTKRAGAGGGRGRDGDRPRPPRAGRQGACESGETGPGIPAAAAVRVTLD